MVRMDAASLNSMCNVNNEYRKFCSKDNKQFWRAKYKYDTSPFGLRDDWNVDRDADWKSIWIEKYRSFKNNDKVNKWIKEAFERDDPSILRSLLNLGVDKEYLRKNYLKTAHVLMSEKKYKIAIFMLNRKVFTLEDILRLLGHRDTVSDADFIALLHKGKIPVKDYLLKKTIYGRTNLDDILNEDSKALEILVENDVLAEKDIIDSFNKNTYISRTNYHYLNKYLSFKKLLITSTFETLIKNCELRYLNDLKKDMVRDGLNLGSLIEGLEKDEASSKYLKEHPTTTMSEQLEEQIYHGIESLLDTEPYDIDCMENLLNKLISMGLSRVMIENVSSLQEEATSFVRVKIIGNYNNFYVQIFEVEKNDDSTDEEWDAENDEGEVAILEDDEE